ncbi:MAG TPA: hypothetical protein VFZ53_31700 [Polyangiaceae bacterium]
MRTLVDDRLRDEARAFAFRFACEDCAHFEPDGARCANGYPTFPHARVDLASRRHLEFCKEFDFAGPGPLEEL